MAKKKTIADNRVFEKCTNEENSLVKKLTDLHFNINIKCKSLKQKEFLTELKKDEKKICFGIGSPGTGKSFISLSYALKEIKSKNYKNIVMIIPTAQAGGDDFSIGYLKGDFYEKFKPFCDSDRETIEKILKLSGNESYEDIAKSLMENNIIKYECVNFLLGKTIEDSIILVNESEQYTKSNLRLILTRIGDNSKIIITGDSKQVNRKTIVKGSDESGLLYAVSKLNEMEEVSVTEFTNEDIVRNEIITKILTVWDK